MQLIYNFNIINLIYEIRNLANKDRGQKIF